MNFFQNILFVACRIFLYFDHKAIQFLKDEKKISTHWKDVQKNKLICHMNRKCHFLENKYKNVREIAGRSLCVTFVYI